MEASLILIGDELVSGKIPDTNGTWLAQQLSRQGIRPRNISLIKDDEEGLTRALSQARNHTDIVVVTGGLGPTPDDRTKTILSHFFSAPLEHHISAEEMVRQHYARRNRPIPEGNSYHLLPRGFAPLFNHCGLAPGLLLDKKGKTFAFLPGVPREMKMMAERELFPRLPVATPADVLTVRTRGVTEEDIFLKLCPQLWQQLESFGQVASLPRSTGIDLHITLSAPKGDGIKTMLNNSPLKEHIWQWGDLSLPALILQKLAAKKLTLGLGESASGGLMASLLTDIPGASNHFRGSVVAYNNAIKKSVLSVPEECLAKGAVSADTAKAMARGVQKLFDTDLAVAITGMAGPPTPADHHPVGTLVVGTVIRGQAPQAREHHFAGIREQLKERFALTGLFALLPLIETL